MPHKTRTSALRGGDNLTKNEFTHRLHTFLNEIDKDASDDTIHRFYNKYYKYCLVFSSHLEQSQPSCFLHLSLP